MIEIAFLAGVLFGAKEIFFKRSLNAEGALRR
jgi:hypothetical protein